MIRNWKVPDSMISEISCIAICPKEENIAVGFKNNSIALLRMSNLTRKDEELIDNNDLFEFIHGGFHDGPISMLDVCMHRPIIASLSRT